MSASRSARERKAERIALDGATCDEAPVHRDRREHTRDRCRGDAERVQQPSRRRLRSAEDVRAEVEPVLAPALRADPPPDPILGLEHDDVEIAQRPGGGEAGDPGSDDDDVMGHRHAAGR